MSDKNDICWHTCHFLKDTSTYGSVSAGRRKCLFYVFFSLKVKPMCDKT